MDTFLTSPVPKTSVEQKRKGREDAKQRRYGTPKVLRDMLREKCRIRIHSARQNLFERCRNLDENNCDFRKPIIEEILRQELAELEYDVELQEKIYEELIDEADEWLAEEYEKEESYLIGVQDILTCPICQQSALELNGKTNIFSCKCSISFFYSGSMEDLRNVLKKTVDEHELKGCSDQLIFYTEPKFNVETNTNHNILNAMCEKFDYIWSF